ncbi:helix-turn-helix domain-containing protein [Streptomyces sp. V4-01]|uniref:Helix-turn-helix domain-containing protein n=1 Tax=Actinacidiphila polyblastidii TaxID=3110430 RepID=A0ABU7P5A0_9ACTN|nr:helix-turn-helix domain-containing protein [Streptomyces sp. V4-01]
MPANLVTDDEREQIRDLHAQGLGRNEIARAIGRGTRTVSVQASKMGLVFDNAEMTDAATRVRKAQLAARRMDLAEALQEDAERLTEQMWEPAFVFNFGGKDNTFEKRPVDEPPADAKKSLMSAAGMAIDRSLKLVPSEETAAEDEAKSMLGQLMVGLKVAYDQAKQEEAGEEAGSERTP